ncbi:MAG: hypothetical protein AB1567_00835 [bacterium]
MSSTLLQYQKEVPPLTHRQLMEGIDKDNFYRWSPKDWVEKNMFLPRPFIQGLDKFLLNDRFLTGFFSGVLLTLIFWIISILT